MWSLNLFLGCTHSVPEGNDSPVQQLDVFTLPYVYSVSVSVCLCVCVRGTNCPSQWPFLYLSEAVWDWGPSPTLCCHSEGRWRAAWVTADPATHIFSSLMLLDAPLSVHSPHTRWLSHWHMHLITCLHFMSAHWVDSTVCFYQTKYGRVLL